MVANAGFRRFLGPPKGEGFTIDPAKVEADARFDGLFVLRTNTRLSALQVVLRYRNRLARDAIHVYEIATGRPVAVILRPGKTPSGKEIRGDLRRLVGVCCSSA